MSLWLCRAGKSGQFEKEFLESGRIYLNWSNLVQDLSKVGSRKELRSILEEALPDAPQGKITQNSGQIWAFVKKMSSGDWVMLPSKFQPSIHVGEITSDYRFDPNAKERMHHYRQVRWIERDIPRSNFDQDILYSLGAFLTICQIKRNNAEARVRDMARHGWETPSTPVASIEIPDDESAEEESGVDLEVIARDQIAKQIIAKFKGHEMATLVEAILAAQGYTVYRSPEGPDKGIDLVAAPGSLGFGSPKICVQVKSHDAPCDHPTLSQLLGTMSNINAERGLLVSWGGFKTSVKREEAAQFFKVRLWDRDDLIDQIFENYDRLPETLRAELPLKRVWTLTLPDDED